MRTKIIEGKTWHFCDHHNQWTHHTTDTCEKKGLNGTANKKHKPFNSNNKTKYNTKAARIAKAMTAIVKEEDDEE